MKSVNRIFLGVRRWAGQSDAGCVVGASILLGLLLSVMDRLIDYYRYQEQLRFLQFKRPQDILDFLVFDLSALDLFERAIFIMTCLVSGLLVARFLKKHLENTEALKASAIRYRRLHETMWDAFVQMDLSGRITDVNAAFEQLLGYPQDRLREMAMAELTPDQWRELDAKVIDEQVLAKGKSDLYEKEFIGSDRAVIPVELRIFLITDDDGKAIFMWAIVRDITKRKRQEQERERDLNALRRSNEDLQQFAYVASHDLQEPLRMVSSYTHLLSERYADHLDEKARKYIAYAVEGAERMQNLIQDLLAYSRVDTRGSTLARVDLNHIFQYAVENLTTLINETNAQVKTDSLPQVNGDETQLVAVFQNLIHNGIKFRKEARPEITISAYVDNGAWVIAVKDNGIGIENKYKEKIFIIFQRLHARSEYCGTGIGLALCKRIIERHNGKIWFDSIPGQGTTFYFSLPVIEPNP